MTEILLNAVLNLFAILAVLLGEHSRGPVRQVLKRYLRDHLRLDNVTEYMGLFDLVLEMHEEAEPDALHAQARDIAHQLRSKLPLAEQHVFLLRFLEPVADSGCRERAVAVVGAVAEGLCAGQDHIDAIYGLCLFSAHDAAPDTEGVLVDTVADGVKFLRLRRQGFEGAIAALYFEEDGTLFATAEPGATVLLESKQLVPGSPQSVPPGSILHDPKGNRIYHKEMLDALQGDEGSAKLVFEGCGLDFRYPKSDNGLHDFSFSLGGGMLVGVMGVSGAGKSTLLSILNGQQAPDSGQLLVNGLDLHRDPQSLEGVIGYVPQDDLLFEELSVFDNLFYNSALCMAHLDSEERAHRVDGLLDELDQLSIRDLKVGSPLEKTISGGQRKRLNIALELLREPSILFVDEPTSGLSSSDSENVMSLLKAQADKGKLVVVVIHQPSSLIYKMFDRLWIMDRGGRPIYDGNPLDAIVHFRSEVFKAGMDEYACPRCGHVNPEQLFEIIETQAMDEDGKYIRQRLVPPQRWHERYLALREKCPPQALQPASAPAERRLWRPGWFGQLGVFFMRTLKGRVSNGQYLLVNLLEPPVLALLAALISHGAWGSEYVFADNENVSIYFFISVVVALFLGLSVSAEEINRDQKILKREQFLNLSWSSYVSAKTLYLFGVAALQMALFVLVGNTILTIPDMTWPTLAVLFSSAAASAVLGLNISSAFKSAVTIYILIPLLLVPQMMLGGAVVPYDTLLHREAGHGNTPLVADLMPSRWGYEALVVRQYLTNDYNRHFLPWILEDQQFDYLSSYHTAEMRSLADYPQLEDNARRNPGETRRRLATLANEIAYVETLTGLESGIDRDALRLESYDSSARAAVKAFLHKVDQELRQHRNLAFDAIRAKKDQLRAELGRKGLAQLKARNDNKDIASLVKNTRSLASVRLSGDRLVQLASPISQPPQSSWGDAPFFSAQKKLGATQVSTFWLNLAVLWGMALALFGALQMKLLPKLFGAVRMALNTMTRWLTCRAANEADKA